MADKQRIDRERLIKPAELSHDALRHLIGLAEKGSAVLVGWERLGVPVIDRAVATFDVPHAEIGRFVQDAFAINGLRARLTGFPNGIPALENIRVQIEASAGH